LVAGSRICMDLRLCHSLVRYLFMASFPCIILAGKGRFLNRNNYLLKYLLCRYANGKNFRIPAFFFCIFKLRIISICKFGSQLNRSFNYKTLLVKIACLPIATLTLKFQLLEPVGHSPPVSNTIILTFLLNS
jgi:hypothetical protein